jgi:nitric oxide dioxygenase
VAQLRRDNPASFRTSIFKTHPASGDAIGVTHDYESRVDLARVAPREDLHLHNGGAEYYVCGPEQFMVEVSEYLKAQGVGAGRVKLELFSTGDLALKQP